MKNLFHPDKGMPGVRCAVEADEDQIFGLLCLLHAENGFFSMNPRKVREGIQLATKRLGGIIFVIEEGKRIVASLGMVMHSDWYTDDEILLERWNFVHPDYRKGTDYARTLVEQSKWASERFTASARAHSRPPVPFVCGIMSLERAEAKVRLYARHMVCVGAFFVYGVTPRQNDRVQEEMRLIEQANRWARNHHSKRVRPLAETILRVSSQGEHHV